MGITNLSKFIVGMPVYFTSSNAGFYTNHIYFVKSVSGSSGAGTITLGRYRNQATLITASASTSLTLNSYGQPAVESDGTPASTPLSSVSSIALNGLDIEGNVTVGLYAEETFFPYIQVAASATTGGPVYGAVRTIHEASIKDYYSHSWDTVYYPDSDAMDYSGFRGCMTENQTTGVFYDTCIGAHSLDIYRWSKSRFDRALSCQRKFYLSPTGNG